MSTDGLPVAERFDGWLEHVSRTVAPIGATCDDSARFRAVIGATELGALQFTTHTVSPCQGYRTARMICRADPELFYLLVNLHGHNAIEQNGNVAALRPGDLVLGHTSQPSRFRLGGATGPKEDSSGLMVLFPGALLPVPHRKVERLTATALSGREGVGALLSGFLRTLAAGAEAYSVADLARLGTTLTDLITALLAHHLDAGAAVPPETGRRTMLMRIHAHIQAHLADPGLSPAAVAVAHNISLRTLHRLFETESSTVAGLIRAQRLHRCRRDLADPSLADRPIHVTAARWGFGDVTSFSRAFRAAYGVNPTKYRQAPSG